MNSERVAKIAQTAREFIDPSNYKFKYENAEFNNQFASIIIGECIDVVNSVKGYDEDHKESCRAADAIKNHFGIPIPKLKVGSRIRSVEKNSEGFYRDVHGVIEYIQPDQEYCWVRPDGAEKDRKYHIDQLKFEI
jgi:hypothetical protein